MKFTYASGSKPLSGYTIKRGIGSGGFGEVYYALSDAGKEVALKLIRRHLDIELRGVRQCLNLKHPNLLALHDIRTDDHEDRWVVMEYVAGESLEDVIERNPNGMPVDLVLHWIRGLAAGVAHLHDNGIVHRDLKPGNLFDDDGIVKIGDYGLSKFVSCSRRSGQTESVGTVHYMAPEIANGRYGKEIDVYAIGIILYEMLTGNVPFDGESVGEVLMKHLTAEPDLSSLAPQFQSIIARSLAKDPQQRFTNAKQLLAALPNPAGESSPATGSLPSASEPKLPGTPATSARPGQPRSQGVTPDDEEPVWRLIRDAGRQVNEQWTAANWNPVVKVVLLVVGTFALVTSAGVWLPILFMLVMVYGAYRIVRAIVIPGGAPAATTPARATSSEPVEQQTLGKALKRTKSWRREKRVELQQKPVRERIRELSGAMLLSAAIALTMSVVMMLLRSEPLSVEQFVWLGLIGTLGTWAIMIPSKIWEGRRGEQLPRRFTLLGLGLLVGLIGYALASFLAVDLPYESTQWELRHGSPGFVRIGQFYSEAGVPQLPAYLAYFGSLFAILRWWKQADPMRATRLSVWSTACAVFAAWVLIFVLPFPQPWGAMVAAIVAVSVQLSSPWQSPDARRATA